MRAISSPVRVYPLQSARSFLWRGSVQRSPRFWPKQTSLDLTRMHGRHPPTNESDSAMLRPMKEESEIQKTQSTQEQWPHAQTSKEKAVFVHVHLCLCKFAQTAVSFGPEQVGPRVARIVLDRNREQIQRLMEAASSRRHHRHHKPCEHCGQRQTESHALCAAQTTHFSSIT